jgi:hypothetical protein
MGFKRSRVQIPALRHFDMENGFSRFSGLVCWKRDPADHKIFPERRGNPNAPIFFNHSRGDFMTKKSEFQERRLFVRIKKHYIIRFYQKDNPSLKYEASQIENISKGGLCFTSTIPFDIGANLAIELRTPYVAEKVYIEGKVLESKEKIKGVIYQNRVKFNDLSSHATSVLEKIEKYNLSQEE